MKRIICLISFSFILLAVFSGCNSNVKNDVINEDVSNKKINVVTTIYFTMGFGQGIMPLIGYNYSSKNGERMKKAIIYTAQVEIIFILIATALCYVNSEELVTLFMKNENVINYGSVLLKGFMLGLPFFCIDFLAVGIFQALGMGAHSLIFAILRKIVLEIPAIYILNKIWPLYGISYSQLCAEVILSIAAIIIVRNIIRKVVENQNLDETKI